MTIYIFLGILFIIGAAVGSFMSVVVYRIHSDKKGIICGRSSCKNCEKKLAPLDLIPIVSYLTLRGKCRYCSGEISYMYPLMEIITGAVFSVLFLKFPFISSIFEFNLVFLGLYTLYAFYAFVLLFTFFFDLHYMKIADEILLPAILIGLIATFAAPLTPNLIDALIGALIPIAFFGLQILLSKGRWIGMGDLRIGAFMGVILGWKLVIVALFLSYIIGSVISLLIVARKKQILNIKVPFAPFLVTGTFMAMFFGDKIINWYLNIL